MLQPLTIVKSDTPFEEVFAIIERDGGVIVENLVDSGLLARLNADLDRVIEEAPTGSKSDDDNRRIFHGRNTKRVTALARRSPAFVELMEHPTLLAYADAALRSHSGPYWLNTGQLMIVGPGEPAQVLHRDQDNWTLFSKLGRTAPEATVSCMLALNDFTEELGATRVIPGSHLWEDYTQWLTDAETVPAVMPAGSGLLYSGKVVHGAGHNRTADQWRRGLHISYVLGWLRPEEAHSLGVPLEVARTLPPRVQELLGYGMYDPAPAYGGRLGLLDFDDPRPQLGLA